MTAKTRIISALLGSFATLALAGVCSSALAQAVEANAAAGRQSGNVLQLAENAPDQHVVVRGDTLWGIAGLFLKDPWRWPEIWHLNTEQIKNPHWIYPGQVVWLDRSGERPQLRLGTPLEPAEGSSKLEPQVRSSDNSQAIASIPQHIIEPFLAQPLIVEADRLEHAPRIIATQEDRVVVGAGDLAYATGVNIQLPLWLVYRPGKALMDPEDGRLLGYEAFHLGSARLLREGEPATLEITRSVQEIGRDDRLVPAPRPEIINYVPHAPARPIDARIVSVYGALAEAAAHSIITLSRGAKEGVEVGHVLALSRSGALVKSRYQGKVETHQLPDEHYGLAFVFRVFDHVSYALVMHVSRPVIVGDRAANP